MRMLRCVQRLARVCERVALLAVSVAASFAFSAVCAAVSQRHGAVCASVRSGAASQALRFAALVLVAAAASQQWCWQAEHQCPSLARAANTVVRSVQVWRGIGRKAAYAARSERSASAENTSHARSAT
jgi:hypothetical protein